jgi:2',3'-cyclic-nucleotide 2'-phosphodiesterase (5'-nucleotidase family)
MPMKLLKFLAIPVLFCISCSKEVPPAEKPFNESNPGEIVVVATNDFHAALDRAEGLASVITELRKRYGDRLVYLDAGDQFQGSLEGNISKGRAVVGFFNLLKLDAASIGNHEFDYGPDISDRITVDGDEDGMGNLRSRVSEATYSFLSANLILDPVETCKEGPQCNALGQKTVFEPHTILQREGKKIGVIGATTITAQHRTSPAYLKGAKFEEMPPVVQAESKFLHEVEKCDWVLLTVHAGLRYEKDGKTLMNTELLSMLQKMKEPLVDAVVAGDVHTPAMEVVRGIPVVQAGAGAKHVGIVHLSKAGDKKQHRIDRPLAVPDVGVSFEATEFMKPYRRKALERKRQTLAVAKGQFPLDKTQETALGNLIATALLDGAKEHGGADVSLINAGALRTELPASTITYSHLFKLFPYDDHLVIAELTGAELKTFLEIAFSGAKGMPAVSGIRVRMTQPDPRDLNGDGLKEDWEQNVLADIRDRNGNTFKDKKIYRLATLSYLVEGGDHQDYVYDQIPQSQIHWFTELQIREIIAAYMKKKSALNPNDYYSEKSPNVLTAKGQ